jgi:leader peptidase (prepilin peptidase)/N-methyltransferase
LLRESLWVLSRGVVITARSVEPGLGRQEMAVPAAGAVIAAGTTATALATVSVDIGWLLLVSGGFAVCGWLAGCDLQTGRVPNRIVVPAIAAVVAAVGIVATINTDSSPLLRAVVGAVVLAGPWLLIGLVTGGSGVGGGDVKLATIVGLLTGLVDPLAVDAALAVSLAAWVVLGLWARFRSRKSFLFGPALVVAGIVGIVVACVLAGSGIELGIEAALIHTVETR